MIAETDEAFPAGLPHATDFRDRNAQKVIDVGHAVQFQRIHQDVEAVGQLHQFVMRFFYPLCSREFWSWQSREFPSSIG